MLLRFGRLMKSVSSKWIEPATLLWVTKSHTEASCRGAAWVKGLYCGMRRSNHRTRFADQVASSMHARPLRKSTRMTLHACMFTTHAMIVNTGTPFGYRFAGVAVSFWDGRSVHIPVHIMHICVPSTS